MTANNVRNWIALGAGLLLCMGNGTVWAQTAADKAAADTLFDEGKRLIIKGDTAAACEKFEASLSTITQLGTQLALASCYEKLGKTASAWAEFRAAASAASKAHDRRQRFAEDHAAALEAKLSKIAVTLEPGDRVDGLEVKRDGARLKPAEFGSPVPVDPGEHTIEATAAGRITWSIKVTISATPGVVDVVVPVLGKVPEPEPPKPLVLPKPLPRADESGARDRTRRTIAYSVGGVGVAAVGVSLIFGALANSKWSDAQAHCHNNQCDQTGFDLASSAHTMGNLSTGSFIVGTVSLTAGAILLLTAPSGGAENAQLASPTALRIVPGVAPSQVGLTIQGGF